MRILDDVPIVGTAGFEVDVRALDWVRNKDSPQALLQIPRPPIARSCWSDLKSFSDLPKLKSARTAPPALSLAKFTLQSFVEESK